MDWFYLFSSYHLCFTSLDWFYLIKLRVNLTEKTAWKPIYWRDKWAGSSMLHILENPKPTIGMRKPEYASRFSSLTSLKNASKIDLIILNKCLVEDNPLVTILLEKVCILEYLVSNDTLMVSSDIHPPEFYRSIPY